MKKIVTWDGFFEKQTPQAGFSSFQPFILRLYPICSSWNIDVALSTKMEAATVVLLPYMGLYCED